MSHKSIREQIEIVAAPWSESPYYADAEKWTSIFWAADTVFRRLFDQMVHSNVLELACGWGRHAEQCIKLCDSIIVMDIFEHNLTRTTTRLSADKERVTAILGDGCTFRPVADESLTAIFCYDAMVHFSPDIVQSYLQDANRVLQRDGMILLHHSNYETKVEQHYGKNPHARNHMTFDVFESFCNETGLQIRESIAIPWGGIEELDRVSLVQKT